MRRLDTPFIQSPDEMRSAVYEEATPAALVSLGLSCRFFRYDPYLRQTFKKKVKLKLICPWEPCIALYLYEDGSVYIKYPRLPLKRISALDGKGIFEIKFKSQTFVLLGTQDVFAYELSSFPTEGSRLYEIPELKDKQIHRVECGDQSRTLYFFNTTECHVGTLEVRDPTGQRFFKITHSVFLGEDVHNPSMSKGYYSDFIKLKNRIYAHGSNQEGQLALGYKSPSSTLTEVEFFRNKKMLGIFINQSRPGQQAFWFTQFVCQDGVYVCGLVPEPLPHEPFSFRRRIQVINEVLQPIKLPSLEGKQICKVVKNSGVTYCICSDGEVYGYGSNILDANYCDPESITSPTKIQGLEGKIVRDIQFFESYSTDKFALVICDDGYYVYKTDYPSSKLHKIECLSGEKLLRVVSIGTFPNKFLYFICEGKVFIHQLTSNDSIFHISPIEITSLKGKEILGIYQSGVTHVIQCDDDLYELSVGQNGEPQMTLVPAPYLEALEEVKKLEQAALTDGKPILRQTRR